MEIGCSQCVADAIVSHQPKILRELLFWVPIGSARGLLPVASVEANTQLVEFSDTMDVDKVGCVGRADCRHEAFDVEQREPIPTVAISDRVLFSRRYSRGGTRRTAFPPSSCCATPGSST